MSYTQTFYSLKYFVLTMSLLFICTINLSAQRTITGTISDSSGEMLIGANVTVKEANEIGTSTDVNGQYSLNIPDYTTALLFSYTGYNTVEVTVSTTNVIDIVLSESDILLDEVVVIGYGSQKRTDISGSISKINGVNIQGKPVTGIDGALQGQVPGLLLTANTGQPGAGMSMRIRGNSSINAGNDPLYVIDGIPVTTGDFSEAYYGGMDHNVLSDLNPSDIASIEVLKDAAAASIYGSRASNGVVLITTKQGEAGKAKVSIGYSIGAQSAINRWEMLSGEQFSKVHKQPSP